MNKLPDNPRPYELDKKTLYLDIEKTPTKGWAYKAWEANLFDIEEDWHIQSVAWAWGTNGEIQVKALPDFPTYKKHPHNDKELVEFIYNILNEAHIIVGHNVLKFDIKMLKHRFIIHGLRPLWKLTIRDTLKMARKYGFISNTLDNVSRELGTGHKLDLGVKDLWKKCYDGVDDKKYWPLFKRYNKHDVLLTRANDRILLSWEDSIPRMTPNKRCPECNSKPFEWKKNGLKYYQHYYKQRYACLVCGFANIYGEAITNEDY